MKVFSCSAGVVAVLLAGIALYVGITKINSPKPVAVVQVMGDPGTLGNPENTVTTSVNIPQREVKQQVQVLRN